ncbi:DnaJ domain protein [Aspergillus ibericus CBS 121593]|uniref:DnaJ-domain-containing protein n=1 Tax=Aspergillus ibericus CBS 121593 TaxID=1448316 RepID=A0A395H0R6_9EURO|nr:DnaJ-domain-containing protein [Aspergillus ibericus CBS 121593]RAL00528.1 DnaJ-domain-containing protein [Aspergillus ibericus CBS 121593]
MPSRRITNYYAILGISHNASAKDINSAYKKLALKYHPDKKTTTTTTTTSDDPSADEFQKIQEAIETLRDPILKQSHDDKLRLNGYRFSDFPDNDHNDPQGTTWRTTQAYPYNPWDPRARYMYSYGNSVHMDPFSPDSLAEKARVQVEIRVGEMLRKEAEMREAAEAAAAAAAAASEEKGEAGAEGGDYDEEEYEEWIGFNWEERPQTYEEFMEFLKQEEKEKAERRRAAMRANVEKDEEKLRRDGEDEGEEAEVLTDFVRGYDFGHCWRSKEAGLSVPREYHDDFYSEDEDDQGVYWEGYGVKEEDDDSDSDTDDEKEVNPNNTNRDENNDSDSDEDHNGNPLGPNTTDQPPDTYYHSDHDSYSYYDDSDEYDDEDNDCVDLYSYDDAAENIPDERSSTEYLTARQSSPDSQTKSGVSTSGGESAIFYDFSEELTCLAVPDETPKRSTPGVNLDHAPGYLTPFIPHFKNKLSHPSGRYTAQDLLTEVTGMILEIYCDWLESIRLTVPEAKPLQKGQEPQHCLHLGGWEKHFNRTSCDECQLWKPLYTLTCPGCGIEACVGCKFSGCCVR